MLHASLAGQSCVAAGYSSCCTSGCYAGGCYCDRACYSLGDCCADIQQICPGITGSYAHMHGGLKASIASFNKK